MTEETTTKQVIPVQVEQLAKLTLVSSKLSLDIGITEVEQTMGELLSSLTLSELTYNRLLINDAVRTHAKVHGYTTTLSNELFAESVRLLDATYDSNNKNLKNASRDVKEKALVIAIRFVSAFEDTVKPLKSNKEMLKHLKKAEAGTILLDSRYLIAIYLLGINISSASENFKTPYILINMYLAFKRLSIKLNKELRVSEVTKFRVAFEEKIKEAQEKAKASKPIELDVVN